ncbi:MAG: hypothetical protein EAX96_05885 [Candidatus Lokiarchaeota archaeon]|nr:hypothetical protein [Candidatus Lokiarchaeota archaeon]
MTYRKSRINIYGIWLTIGLLIGLAFYLLYNAYIYYNFIVYGIIYYIALVIFVISFYIKDFIWDRMRMFKDLEPAWFYYFDHLPIAIILSIYCLIFGIWYLFLPTWCEIYYFILATLFIIDAIYDGHQDKVTIRRIKFKI